MAPSRCVVFDGGAQGSVPRCRGCRRVVFDGGAGVGCPAAEVRGGVLPWPGVREGLGFSRVK
jgi:hypothetical protein